MASISPTTGPQTPRQLPQQPPRLDVGPGDRDGAAAALQLYRWMRLSRTVESVEAELAASGDAFFHLPTLGHEGIAALALSMTPDDWLHIHYRDKPLCIARGITPLQVFNDQLCNADAAGGGHQMACFHASAELNLASTPVPVGNHATHCVGIAAQLREQGRDVPGGPLVFCGLGDGSTHQGEVHEAIAEAVRRNLSVVFYVEVNGLAISTRTAGRTFFDLPGGPADSYLGLPLHRYDARAGLIDALPGLADTLGATREQRGPAIVLLRCERLTSHTNADDHRVYLPADEIEAKTRTHDPLVNLRAALLDRGLADAAALDTYDARCETEARAAAEQARAVAEPVQVGPPVAKPPLPEHVAPGADEYRGSDTDGSGERLLMIEAMRGVLRHRLDADPRVTLMGEDIEDPKGDVFGVTRGLSTAFPGRVNNSSLSEATIIGECIGRAMLGSMPVGFIQFADFLPNGINQVLSEMGTIWWRTRGEFSNPMILMITCGGYRPGLGPFHSQTFESILCHVPGIDVIMPSTAGDAAGLLNAAFESGRPTVFLYPKTCLNDRARSTSDDVDRHLVPLGVARKVTRGDALTLVAWGSTVDIAEGVSRTLKEKAGVDCDLLDLRSLQPWDREAVVESAGRTGRLIVLHEDNLSAGFGAEVVAWVAEHARTADGAAIACRRIARPDVPVPSNFSLQLEALPSYRGTLAAACEMLGLDLSFAEAQGVAGDVETILAEGAAPTDQAVTVTEWKVAPGDSVRNGQVIADLEADKAVFEMAAPADGVVEELLAEPEDEVAVGTPLLTFRPLVRDGAGPAAVKRPNREDRGNPVITGAVARRGVAPDAEAAGSAEAANPAARASAPDLSESAALVYLSPIHFCEGNRRLTNADLERRFPGRSGDDIVKRTGIESRPVLGPEQTALSIAIEAAVAALAAEGLTLDDLTGIVCHTTTPPLNTPSMACMVLDALDTRRRAGHPSLKPAQLMVYDVNAACSGWLYALDTAFNTIRNAPDDAVLVVTTEALSRVVDPTDFDTAILFGDAATATIVRGARVAADGSDGSGHRALPPDLPAGAMVLTKPLLSGKADPERILTVGFEGQGHITMEGKKVFAEGVRAMTTMTNRAFEAGGRSLEEVDYLVPHQANRRIFDAVRQRLKIPTDKVLDTIGCHGNTSSSSIPLAIAKSMDRIEPGDVLGLCAFGGGFTFGAALLEVAPGSAPGSS